MRVHFMTVCSLHAAAATVALMMTGYHISSRPAFFWRLRAWRHPPLQGGDARARQLFIIFGGDLVAHDADVFGGRVR
jgi:hypothetical protein